MDIVYSVNSQSEDLRWGDPAAGSLSNSISLGFTCYQVVVMPNQRYVYITGYKRFPGDPVALCHAWLSVIDSCNNSVTSELDLGVGFAWQCAVPPGVHATRAFVAVSQALSSTDTGPHGGINRIEVLDISNVANPVRFPPAVNIPGTPFGPLFIVWSNAKSLLYTTHRGDSNIFAFPPTGAPAAIVIPNLGQQPTGLAVDALGLTLYIGRRLSGDVLRYDLAGAQPMLSTTYSLPNGVSQSGIYVVVDRFGKILATSNRPNDGIVYRIDPAQPQAILQIDTQGTLLGEGSVTPDGSRAYVPRGGQNDLAEIDLMNNTLTPIFIGVGNRPTDAAFVSQTAGQTLEATPRRLSMDCNAPQQITIRAFDACHTELQGVSVRSFAVGPVAVNPPNQLTPAQFQVECLQGGSHSVTFAETALPFVPLTVPIYCNCPVRNCVDFSLLRDPMGNPVQGLLPPVSTLAGIAEVTIPNGAPNVAGTRLAMLRGTVLFRLNQGRTIGNLVISYRRQDPFTPLEELIVTLEDGATLPPIPAPQGFLQGDFDIACAQAGIKEWLLTGGGETLIFRMCFDADFTLPS